MGEAGARGDSFTFSAFISYARKDRAEAVRLQRRLEQYRLDADLRVKEGERFFPARPLQPVFRDEDELVPGQDLPERIRKGLAGSRYLIVMASIASVQSRWVEKEILDFMAMGKADRIIILVIDGEPNAARSGKAAALESLPRPFRIKFAADGQPTDEPAAEPNWVDWRGRRKSDRINFLRLVSALLELDRFDDLLRRDAASERRRLRLFQAATATVVALGLAAGLGAVLAAQQLNEVRTTESRFLARLADDLAEPAGDAAKGDHLRALQVAIDGAPTASHALYPRPLTLETEVALRRSLSHLRLKHFMQHEFGVRTAAMSPDGTRIATVSRSEVPWVDHAVVTLWDGESGTLVRAPTKVADGGFADNFAVAFSPDGKRVLASAGTAAHLFDAATGTRIGQALTEPARTEKLERARLSADGLRVLTDDALWDARTGARIRALPRKIWTDDGVKRIVALLAADTTQLIDGASGAAIGAPVKHAGNVVGVSFSHDRIAIAAKDNKVSLWDATTGTATGIVVTTGLEPNAIHLTGAGTRLLTIAGVWEAPREAQLWDTRTGKPVGNTVTASAEFAVAVSPDGTRLALTPDDETSTGGSLIETATGGTLTLLDDGWVHFSPDSRFLVAVGSGGQAQLWNARAGFKVGDRIDRGADITGVAFSDDGGRVLIASADGAGLWETTGHFLHELKHDDPEENARFGTATHISSLSAIFSADGATVLTASSDASARLWNIRPSLLTPRKLSHPGRIRALAVSPDGKTIATAGEDESARLWDERAGTSIGAAMAHQATVEGLVFSPDGARLLTMASGDAHLWNARDGAAIASPLKHDGVVTAAVFSPDGTRVATASDDDTATLWDARTGAQIGSPMKHDHDVRGVAFSPDGTSVLTVSGPEESVSPDGVAGAPIGEARLWNALTGAPLGSAMKHAAFVNDATFSPDGARVATASADKTVRLWDARSGAPLKSLKHAEGVTRVSFNAGGNRIVTTTAGELDTNHEAHLWSGDGERIADMPQGNPTNAEFSPDGTRIATSRFLREDAYLFDAVTGKPLAAVTHSRERGREGIWRTMFSGDGTIFATSGSGVVRLWDARTGTSIGEPLNGEIVEGADGFAFGAAHIVTASGNDAHLWNITTWNQTGAPLIANACAKLASIGAGPLPRDLTARSFRRPEATPACRQRGLLDWRFYTDALFGR